MATILDISLLQSFDVVYPVILVFALVYALLHKTQALTENVVINAMVAFVASITILLSRTIIDIINFMIPWFVVAIIFAVLLLLIFQIFGLKEGDISDFVKKDKAVGWVILGVSIVIIVAAFGSVLGQSIGPFLEEQNGTSDVATGSFEQNVTATLFNPKILGMMVIFGIGVFTVALLTSKQE